MTCREQALFFVFGHKPFARPEVVEHEFLFSAIQFMLSVVLRTLKKILNFNQKIMGGWADLRLQYIGM